MARKDFQLIGHDSPLGYPAPVVPIGFIQDHLVAIYASDRATEIYLDGGEQEFIKHNDSMKKRLKEFDYQNDRLFGFSRQRVDLYAIDRESEYFAGLLAIPNFSVKNPFMRLSLAKATGDGYLLMREIGQCVIYLQNTVPSITDNWYKKQRQMLAESPDSYSGFFLPDTWQVLFDLLSSTITNPIREIHRDEPLISITGPEAPPQGLNETDPIYGLWERYHQGNETAREELLLFYLPLVEYLAKQIARRVGGRANREDLKQYGVIGLMQALNRFDASRGVDFRTFAKPYIRGAILSSPEINRDMPRRQRQIISQIRQVETKLAETLGRPSTIDEVAAKTGLTGEQILNAIDAMAVAFARELTDADEAAAATTVEAAPTETAILVREALSQLSEREALVVLSYYRENQSSKKISQQLGLTVSSVSRIRQRAISKLRKLLGIKEGGGHDKKRLS